MLHFNFPEIKKIHKLINPNDVYEDESDDSYGLETDPHVTLLYGLHDNVSNEDIKKVIQKINFGSCEINNISIFENEEYDVLKYNVHGDGLIEANIQLRRFPNTNEYSKYQPHLTVAYLKPKTGKKYIKTLQGNSFILIPLYATYSKTDGSKEKLNISVKK
jgi:2'-5' RNA ligase